MGANFGDGTGGETEKSQKQKKEKLEKEKAEKTLPENHLDKHPVQVDSQPQSRTRPLSGIKCNITFSS